MLDWDGKACATEKHVLESPLDLAERALYFFLLHSLSQPIRFSP
jgi:hypothetical protein